MYGNNTNVRNAGLIIEYIIRGLLRIQNPAPQKTIITSCYYKPLVYFVVLVAYIFYYIQIHFLYYNNLYPTTSTLTTILYIYIYTFLLLHFFIPIFRFLN